MNKAEHRRMLLIMLLFVLPAMLSVTVQAKTKVNYKLYSDFLKQNEFIYKLKKPSDNGDKTYGLTFYDTYGSRRYERKSISFCLIDLNGDGVKELVVGRMASNWSPKAMILYVFTIRGGKVKFVRYKGTDDYSIRTKGQKLRFSERYQALYCPSLIQNSDAYVEDETETWGLYSMKGSSMVRPRYAESRLQHALDGSEKTVRTYSYQALTTSSDLTEENVRSSAYAEYMDTFFKDLELKSFRMYRNTAANRRKLLGRA